MGSVDAAPTDLETVRRILREHAPELEVRAFGSRVSWTARETSDLDLALMTNEPLDAARMAVLRSAFTDSRLPFRVDVVDWAGASDSFRKVIESEYVTLVGKGEQRSGEGWTTMTLSRFAPLAYGKGLKSDVRNSSGHVPVFGSNGQVGWHDKALTDGPTVIVGRKGTVGSVHYSSEPCWPIDTTFFISDGDTELMRFKYYALSALDLETMNTDSAVPGLNRNAFHAREIRTPPLPKQRAIARVLGALYDKIDLNRRMNGTLEAMARALFKSWFVDFAPVRAKAEGRDTGLPTHIADLFPDRLVDSELGEIPEGWNRKPVSDFVSIKGGKQLPKDKFVEDGTVPVFGGAGLMGYTNDYNTEGFVVSVGRVGAYCGQFFAYRGQAWINNNASLITCKKGVSGEWIYLSLQNLDIDLIKKGAAQPFVSNSDIAAMKIISPSTYILEKFQMFSEPLFSYSDQTKSETKMLIDLRDTLLPKLVSGDLRLGEAVERLESTA